MTASRIGWGLNLRMAKILHRAGIATALALLCLMTFAPAPARAQAPGMFTVRDVPVDATAENAAQAREAALRQGQQAALRRLLERLTPAEVHADLPMPPPSEVENMVLGLSLRDEKTSNVRYLADITVRFMPQAVTDLLESAGLPYSADPAPPLLVLPLWKASPESPPVLWEDPNPWRHAWSTLPRGGLQPIEAPLGDLEDVMAVDAERAAEGLEAGTADLQGLAERYGVEDVLIARATLRSGGGATPPGIDVVALRNGTRYTASVEPRQGEDLAEGLRRAADAIRDQLATEWKSRSALPAGPASQVTALVPISSLHDWLTVRRALTDAREVGAWTLQALTRDRAQVTLDYRGQPAALGAALAPYGLSARQEAGYWVIEPGRPAPMMQQPGAGTYSIQTQPPRTPQAPSQQLQQTAPMDPMEPMEQVPPANGATIERRTIGSGVTTVR